jgi:hypothetical protein
MTPWKGHGFLDHLNRKNMLNGHDKKVVTRRRVVVVAVHWEGVEETKTTTGKMIFLG